jgi:O-antigen/teichoic acid export membrane protein
VRSAGIGVAAMNRRVPSFAVPAGLFIAARLINMVVGLAMIPLLIHFLGGIGFATWAILLSCSVVFSELQLGIPAALVREVAVRPDHEAAAELWSSAAAMLIAIYAALFPVVMLSAAPLGDWLRLPLVGRWHPGAAIVAVYVCVALRAVMMTGSYSLLATFRFRYVAGISLAQALVSNTVATAAASLTRDLASTLVCFWLAQLAVVGAAYFIAQRHLGWRPALRLSDRRHMRGLVAYGVKIQVGEWAQTINFQADKFIIVRMLGLWPAALYEVANRSIAALRSIPASGMTPFLPIAAQEAGIGGDAAAATRRMVVAALYGVLVLFAAPLAVAPVFLYAWVGEMGYVSRHVFTCLAVGTAANLLVRPVTTLAQASGHAEIPARAATVSILLNLPLSLVLVQVWGVEGAALGSSIAMVVGAAVLLRQAAMRLGREAVKAVRDTLVQHWPLVVVCLLWGIAIHHAFRQWFLATPIQVRYGIGLRLRAGVLALGLYAACLLVLAIVKMRVIGVDEDEAELVTTVRAALTRWFRL